MADITIIQSTKNNDIVTDGGSVTATFDSPVSAGNSVIAVGSLQHGVVEELGEVVLLVGSTGYTDGSPAINVALLSGGYPAGGPEYNGPVIQIWLLQTGGLSIAGLTEVFAQASSESYGEIKISIYEVAGLNTIANWETYSNVSQVGDSISGSSDSLPAIDSFRLYWQPPALFVQAIYDSVNTGSDFTSSLGYDLTDNLDTESGSLGIFLKIFTTDPTTYGGDTVSSSNFSTAMLMASAAIDSDSPPPPPPAAPLRYKRIPLTLDFASTTWDQQSRLTMYELYRSCGLDPLNAFLLSLYEWLFEWNPPVTITLTVWSEAVDASWNVLKSVLRGQVITIDPSVSVEWAGDYEVMETTYNPFQGDASQFSTEGGGDPSTVIGSSAIATPADTNAGTMILKLRTYNPYVFFDVSQTPSYVDLPGPIEGDPEA